jgi:hypothetical protein
VFASEDGSSLSLLVNGGNGTFHAPAYFGAGGRSVGVIAALLDGDTRLDLAVVNPDTQCVSVLLGLALAGCR